MAVWKYACKTIQGMNLDLKLVSRGNLPLKLIKSMSGAGRTSPTQLMTLSDLIEPVQELQIQDAVERLESGMVKIPVLLKNNGVAKKYDMYQLGIYAQDPDLGEILYMVLQSDSAEEIPASTEIKDFTLEWYLNLSVGNTQDVEVVIDETCVLTTEQADARYVSQTGDTSNTTTKFVQASTRENIISGEKLSVIFGKLMKWFADLKTVAFSGKYTDLTDKPTIPAAVRVKGDAENAYRTGNVNLTAENIGAAKQNLVGAEVNDAYGHTNIEYSYIDEKGAFRGFSSAENLTEALKDATKGTAKGVEALLGKFDGFIKTGTFGSTHPGRYTLIGNKIVFATIEWAGSSLPIFDLSELYWGIRRAGVSNPYPSSGSYGIFDVDIKVIHQLSKNTWECGFGYLKAEDYNRVYLGDGMSSSGAYLITIKYIIP